MCSQFAWFTWVSKCSLIIQLFKLMFIFNTSGFFRICIEIFYHLYISKTNLITAVTKHANDIQYNGWNSCQTCIKYFVYVNAKNGSHLDIWMYWKGIKNLIQQVVLNIVKDLQQALSLFCRFSYTGQYIHYI